MKHGWRIYKRDVKRLSRVPKAWIIIIGVLITPALYAWFNINAFWDPYANTANIRVAVVDLDEGATSDLTGHIDIGEQVTEQLEDNDQLGWQFMGEDEAQEAVKKGDVYAAIVIPAQFSEDLLSITSGDFTQPALQYYVNEKAGAIAPKITDVGASELDKQVTTAFKEQVALAATNALKDVGDSTELRLLNARDNTLNAFDQATQTLSSARENLAETQEGLTSSRGTLSSARGTLGDVDKTLGDVQKSLAQTQSIITETQKEVIAFTDSATTAFLKGTTLLADASSKANVSITRLTQSLEQAGVRIDAGIDDVSNVLKANEAAAARLQTLLDNTDLSDDTKQRLTEVIASLQQRNATDQQLLADLKTLKASASDTVASVQATADAVDQAMQDTRDASAAMRDILTRTVPSLNSAMSQLSASVGSFSAALDAQKGVLAQADQLLAGLDSQLVATSSALQSFDNDLAGIEQGLQTSRTDVVALNAASEWGLLGTLTDLEPEQIAQFISSPVEVDEHLVFPVDTYGSAMAALFTNLSLWIGAFVLMVIFRVEVDTEGVEDVTVRQAYFGRFFLFATLAIGQALIVCIGNLIIGVQTVSAAAFVGTGVLIALAYVSIIYALCVAFGHVGRGLCILLVIMQIPGASGLYPIELMPGFFRAIYPLLPFSYGIDAMRETIGGFYGGHYWRFLGALAVFVALAFLVGLVLRRRLANFTLLFNRQVLSTDLLIGEKVQVVGSGYRLTDVIRALSNRAEYRDDLARRAEPFTRRYPTLLKATVLTGAAGLVVLGVLTWALPESKALLLGLWTLWILLVIGFLVTIEYIKHSFQNGEEVAALDEAELRQLALAGPAGHAAVLPVTTAEPLPSTSSAPIAATEAEAPVTDATAERHEPAAGVEADALLTEWFGSEPQPDAAPEPDPGAEPDAEPVQPETTAAVDAPEDEGPTRTAEPEEDERAEHQRAEGEDRA
ncbi:YhgE/Pip family protein [Microbacterium maritypicum]|uniref:YhgE/Pip family protein n=1 Tax=Microbacterium maritypicum TaxID=33918 RepID=UPI002671D54C|nr:YhgE/Pip family protein [Microbacterium liquefaciens]WKT89945.1 YhgE/Pip family protein [Microbacterium liquefaciens]